jgi:hypothetical protein
MCETARVAGLDPDSHVSASFWENGFFFLDPHHFGKQERNEAKYFRALMPKRLICCFFLLSLHHIFRFTSTLDNFATKAKQKQPTFLAAKDKKLLNFASFRFQKVFCIILLHICRFASLVSLHFASFRIYFS